MTKAIIKDNRFYFIFLSICFIPYVTPAMALGLGIILSLVGLRPQGIQKYTSNVLQISIVLLGFGMNLSEVITASKDGFIETLISVFAVLTLGILLGKLLKVEKNITLLIAVGTAICGGSAIAAVSPILRSKDYQNSFALIVVFILNVAALLIFPFIGHYFNLSQETFGNWAAIAIHDTSSVVGAGAAYGEKALQVATTVKLIRALWIIPVSIVVALLNKNKEQGLIKFPWFILFFLAAILVSNLFNDYQAGYQYVSWFGKRGLVVALFLLGSNISLDKIKQSGLKSFVLGITLWIVTATVSLLILKQ